MNKNDFLQKLKDITPQEINKIIEENGKPPKLINPITYVKK